MRSAVERFYGWLKTFRRITIRYERLAMTYKAFINIHSMDNNIPKMRSLEISSFINPIFIILKSI